MRVGLVAPLAHVVVGGGDDLIDAAARLGQLRHVAEIDRRDFRAGRERRQRFAVARERADLAPDGDELARDHAAELTRGADNEHSRFAHCGLRATRRPSPI